MTYVRLVYDAPGALDAAVFILCAGMAYVFTSWLFDDGDLP